MEQLPPFFWCRFENKSAFLGSFRALQHFFFFFLNFSFCFNLFFVWLKVGRKQSHDLPGAVFLLGYAAACKPPKAPAPTPPLPTLPINRPLKNPRRMWLLQIHIGGRQAGRKGSRARGALGLSSAAASAVPRRSLRQKSAVAKGGQPTQRLISSRASEELGVVAGCCVTILDIICFLLMFC